MKKPSSDTMRCQRCAACVVDTIVYVGLIALGLGFFLAWCSEAAAAWKWERRRIDIPRFVRIECRDWLVLTPYYTRCHVPVSSIYDGNELLVFRRVLHPD
jgi:hypothetical protein